MLDLDRTRRPAVNARMIRMLVALFVLIASPAFAADPAVGLQPKFTAT
jgi:hypothetical protein